MLWSGQQIGILTHIIWLLLTPIHKDLNRVHFGYYVVVHGITMMIMLVPLIGVLAILIGVKKIEVFVV